MRTKQWVQAATLLLLGVYLLDNMVSGQIYFYINMRYGWLSWLGTGVLLSLGMIQVVDLVRGARADGNPAHVEHESCEAGEYEECCESDEHHGHEPNHDHSHGHAHSHAPSWPKLAIIAVPLIVGAVVPAKPLGAAAIGTTGVSNTFTSVSGNTTQLTIAPNERNVLDWIRAFNGSSNITEFIDQPADLIGFVYRDIRFKDKAQQFMVARFALSCCVADASAIGITVQFPQAATLVQDSWVHVTGKFQVQDVGGQPTPVLIAQVVEPTQQPVHPYIYP